jgi:Plasmid pRiA4b ORF-3-like protein
MSNKRKMKGPRGTAGQGHGLRLVTGQGTVESPRSGNLRAVGSPSAVEGGRELPAVPEAAASSIHVLVVSLHGAAPPPWRRLELPSAITLDRLHEVLQWTFGWSNFGPHSFVTIYGEFGGPARPTSRAAKRAAERRDESGAALAQAAGGEGDGIAYLYGYDDEWRVDILVETIRSAAPGVAYPRCTGGQGEDTPGEGYQGVSEFNAEREEFAPDMYFDPEELTEDLADLATVIIPRS